MGKPSHLVEFEHMVLGRHQLSSTTRRHQEGRMERSAYIMLSRIEVQGPMSIGQLSDAFQLDVSTVNRQTAHAMRAGLLERIPDPEGGMARKFRLTGEGERKLREERELHVQDLDRVFEDWSADDVEHFARYLQRFNTSVERITGQPWPRS
ncbi:MULTISPECIES: MarR family winged helix-turn-helix transcriptional regulator [Streptomyces]|uniref:DNA-binding MarR family transcriptional regulator n=1 Tax=Streptomyces murinus TaxID=33900 RepID=A0A7W3NUW1_STRMR|nr:MULTISPECIES: MarR family transcriptional regulator [Streptomyces]NDK25676.1 MarR family transcriptional regulator [Streptomyces sp. TR1341]MBA9057191.1 DNA-binding MarR family transcriptional regulator [Streptomyces murinus]UWW91536.1 MarR family transcriptional regulator [Streptomyces murinus]WSI88799.1 MarR family transcriptional regulator [Streptomyces murinus]WUD10467.1 MarR family transcriptional regulator [Streptomyces murinus]